jgi:hypothetical protein
MIVEVAFSEGRSVESVSTGTGDSVHDGDIIVEVAFIGGISLALGITADSIEVTLAVALSSETEVLDGKTLDDSGLFTRAEDVTGKIESEEEAFASGAGVMLGKSPDAVNVPLGVAVG